MKPLIPIKNLYFNSKEPFLVILSDQFLKEPFCLNLKNILMIKEAFFHLKTMLKALHETIDSNKEPLF